MNYTLSESVTAYAADHYGPAIALALDEPKERNDRRHLCIRERRLAEAPPADAANARASLQPTSNDRTSPILLSETFWLTEINPPPETAITRQTTIRLAVAPRERFAFSVSLALGSGTFESADIYNGKRCVGQGHIIELFRNPKNYLQISRERSDIWLSPMLGMKLLFVLCSRLLIEDLVECGNIFSVTGRKTNSREPSVVPREAFGVTLKALPNLELLQDTDGGYIDLKNNSVRVEGNCWNNVTIRRSFFLSRRISH